MSSTTALRKAGLKATLPRIKILEFLEKTEERHLSAEDIYKAMLAENEEVGLATIYRVLTQFEAAGMVVRHHFEGDRSLFELGANNGANHHDHLVCERCGRIQEFFDEVIEDTQIKVAERFGFKIVDHSLHIQGICADCQQETD
ncbi:MAG: ferric iron uptake transcriptional regulator [Immundisolibacteraceae bacterium]|nr:ferric iron uptake transcriptional regulator [Immundisolibacteraceae bacterium]